MDSCIQHRHPLDRYLISSMSAATSFEVTERRSRLLVERIPDKAILSSGQRLLPTSEEHTPPRAIQAGGIRNDTGYRSALRLSARGSNVAAMTKAACMVVIDYWKRSSEACKEGHCMNFYYNPQVPTTPLGAILRDLKESKGSGVLEPCRAALQSNRAIVRLVGTRTYAPNHFHTQHRRVQRNGATSQHINRYPLTISNWCSLTSVMSVRSKVCLKSQIIKRYIAGLHRALNTIYSSPYR
ncbi:hypothetical protein BC832DRAFT_269628 [Gaertneriomyces semiglobifer]|nr:hypothetical protein BC832DRAFT_269628 [Gaertneriomyces semiglobifer]